MNSLTHNHICVNGLVCKIVSNHKVYGKIYPPQGMTVSSTVRSGVPQPTSVGFNLVRQWGNKL